MPLDNPTLQRERVLRPQDWGAAAATDYWAFWGDLTMADAAASDLVANGWLTTGFSHLVGSDGDFLSSSDVGVPGGLNFDTADDFILSPFIFGDHAHALMVEKILGYYPTKLNIEVYARFVASGDENESAFGFYEAGTTGPMAVGEQMAAISIGATKFELHSGVAEDAGSNHNNNQHLWKITLSGTTAEWFIDGVSQGTVALQTDLFPVAFGVCTRNAGVNDPVVAWTHIWYS